MTDNKALAYIGDIIKNLPSDWLDLTTHRLDIYDESQAKTQFLQSFEALFKKADSSLESLSDLPTAYDYIRLGHPLSCVLEWAIAQSQDLKAENVISFSSETMPIHAILRENKLNGKSTRILYSGELPQNLNPELLKSIYGFQFELIQIEDLSKISEFEGSTILISQPELITDFELSEKVDFNVNIDPGLGSIILVSKKNDAYVSRIQHVRRRETIAMTPANCLLALEAIIQNRPVTATNSQREANKAQVLKAIAKVTGASSDGLVASSGLSIQYAIMMGLIHDAIENHPGREIKFIVPTNCYGGTNDQARRVASYLPNVEVVDLLVDGGNDMVSSLETILKDLASKDAVPYIIAEIPTNPRVEVPDLSDLQNTLSKKRKTANGEIATEPLFILDQTFCPNTLFLSEGEMLSRVNALSYVSGSKFPSGGRCTGGYVVANSNAAHFMKKIALHLDICDNEATDLQYEILAQQMPSMNQRVADAYKNTRDFVSFIEEKLPSAKINFVSEELARRGFTPSVFSLDLPTKGDSDEEREAYKRKLNLELIDMMINEIPKESKYCVSYGQLKGCYWTIPATSTQGTTSEGHKDYIARVAVSPDLDLDKHKQVFADFVDKFELV